MSSETKNTICEACGAPYIKNRPKQSFCSGACRARFWRIRSRIIRLAMDYLRAIPKAEQERRVKIFEELIDEAFGDND